MILHISSLLPISSVTLPSLLCNPHILHSFPFPSFLSFFHSLSFSLWTLPCLWITLFSSCPSPQSSVPLCLSLPSTHHILFCFLFFIWIHTIFATQAYSISLNDGILFSDWQVEWPLTYSTYCTVVCVAINNKVKANKEAQVFPDWLYQAACCTHAKRSTLPSTAPSAILFMHSNVLWKNIPWVEWTGLLFPCFPL